jgi:hypothetical protein
MFNMPLYPNILTETTCNIITAAELRGELKLMKPTLHLQEPKTSMINPELIILVKRTVHDFPCLNADH